MAETFPIQCRSCAEILDVAADIDAAAPFNCPLCGADIVIAEAEDFDLPCPAAVVVEDHTAERLRIRLPRGLTRENSCLFAVLILGGGPVFGLLFGICALWVSSGRRPAMFVLFMLAGLSFFIIFLFTSFSLFGSTCIEVSNGQLVVEGRLWFLGRRWQRNIDCISCVSFGAKPSNLWPFRDHVHFINVGTKPRNGFQCAESANRDAARYVTHLIRRQLITMGRELHDG